MVTVRKTGRLITNDQEIIGCLLTRRGSKMLGTHQMVDCINCMFGYCVLIGCLATEGGRQ